MNTRIRVAIMMVDLDDPVPWRAFDFYAKALQATVGTFVGMLFHNGEDRCGDA